MESIINKLPKHKAPGPDAFCDEVYQTLKENSLQSLPEDKSRWNTS